MKAILVIDMPDGVEAEDYYLAYGLFTHKGEKPFRVAEIAFQCEEVDLRPLPQKMSWGHTSEYIYGYNACLEEITGETE